MSLACVEVDGGAVELSWSIRDFEGCQASCDLRDRNARCEPLSPDEHPNIGQVRVCWENVDSLDGGADDDLELEGDCGRDPANYAVFACEEVHGVTRFEIDEGRTAIWIEPLCENTGQPPAAALYDVPAPIVRDIKTGGVSTLNALLIVADPEACEP